MDVSGAEGKAVVDYIRVYHQSVLGLVQQVRHVREVAVAASHTVSGSVLVQNKALAWTKPALNSRDNANQITYTAIYSYVLYTYIFLYTIYYHIFLHTTSIYSPLCPVQVAGLNTTIYYHIFLHTIYLYILYIQLHTTHTTNLYTNLY